MANRSWRDPQLLDDERTPRNVSTGDAEEFLGAVAQRLGVPRDAVFPAYEDALYYQWREQQLPINVDHAESSSMTRRSANASVALFKRGLDEPVGFVLPLRHEEARFRSGRRARGSCARNAVTWYPVTHPSGFVCPSVPALGVEGRLPVYTRAGSHGARAHRCRPIRSCSAGCAMRTPRPGPGPTGRAGAPTGEIRGAGCTDCPVRGIREGRLHVFMPPADTLEAYLELIAAVEATAASLAQPVVIEGYEPPRDARLNSFRITPDPGVIEVNIHPSSSWDELVGRTTHLYEDGAADAADHREVHDRRPSHRNGRRQSLRAGRRDAGRLPLPAQAGPAAKPAGLLAQPSIALLSVFRAVHRAHHRRRAWTRRATIRCMNWRSRSSRCRRRRALPAVAGGPPVPQPADRSHRQYPSRGILDRQDVFTGRPHRPPGLAGVAGVRDAAA